MIALSSKSRLERLTLDEPLGAVYRWARELALLRDAVAAVLPATESVHLVGVSTAAPGRLILFSDSAAWCTRLRYHAPMLEAAALPFLGLRPRLEFRTLPAVFQSAPSQRLPLSARATATLRSAARTIKDPALAAALKRLAETQPATGPQAGPA
ncbi:MAG: hypothetical protein ACREN3_03090 [Gemmatimonadaceae bacterium]